MTRLPDGMRVGATSWLREEPVLLDVARDCCWHEVPDGPTLPEPATDVRRRDIDLRHRQPLNPRLSFGASTRPVRDHHRAQSFQFAPGTPRDRQHIFTNEEEQLRLRHLPMEKLHRINRVGRTWTGKFDIGGSERRMVADRKPDELKPHRT